MATVQPGLVPISRVRFDSPTPPWDAACIVEPAGIVMNPNLANVIVAAWDELSALGVEHLDVFGSQARGDATETSDVDVLVHMRGQPTLRALVAIRDRLEELLGRPVDVLTPGALEQRPRLRDRVLREAIRVA